MHYLIYGAGALGQALGCMLASSGNRVTLVLRERFVEVITDNGLKVEGIFGDYRVEAAQLDLSTSISDHDGSTFDAVLLTTKSYDTPLAIKDISSLKNCTCPVVSMQNGCGNIEQLIGEFGVERSLGARVITGFEIAGTARVRITVSADDVHIGGSVGGTIPEQASLIAESIAAAGLPCIAVENVHQSLFAKLLYNCALNPLGAVLEVNYGALAEHDQTRAIMDRVIEETFAVVNTMGIHLPWHSPKEYQAFFYQTLIPATYGHRPSMLQDLEQGKPTEVDALVGYVSEHGRQKNIPTPYCDLLGSLIRYKEKRATSNSELFTQ